MLELRHPGNRFLAVVLHCVRLYLVCFLVGCAATRPLPVEEARKLQTRDYGTDYETLFDAARASLQDLNYIVTQIDFEAGTIVAGRDTDRELGQIATGAPGDEEGLPTWAIVLLVVTGVIIIVGAIALLSGSDDDDTDGNQVDQTTHVTEVVTPGPSVYEDFYRYDVTLNLTSLAHGATRIRVNVNGMHIEDGQVEKAGPVHDARFYEEFFGALDEAVRLEEERLEGEPGQE